VIVKDSIVSDKVELIKRFGHNVDDHIMPGTNAKASEFQAAMGLCNLRYIDNIIEKRKIIFELYNDLLSAYYKTPTIKIGPSDSHNYSYYPVLLKDSYQLDKILTRLNSYNIFPRKYFYPSLNKLPYLSRTNSCPISEDISSRILCLPLYDSLSVDDTRRICKIMIDGIKDV